MAPLDRIIRLLLLAEWTRPDDSRIDVADLIGQSADPVATASAWQRRRYGGYYSREDRQMVLPMHRLRDASPALEARHGHRR